MQFDTVKTFNSIALLRDDDVVPQSNEVATLLGYYSPGDGGGGQFYWDQTSTQPDNGGTVIWRLPENPADPIPVGRWKRIFSDSVNVKWFGAKGTDVYNPNNPGTPYTEEDTLAIQRCADFCKANDQGVRKKMVFPEGRYYTGKIDITGVFAIEGANMNVRLRSKPGEDIFYWKAPGETGYVQAVDIEIRNFQMKVDRTDADAQTKDGRMRLGLGGERVGNAAIVLPGQISGLPVLNTGHYFDNLSIQSLGGDVLGHGDCGIFYAGPAYKINFGSKVEIRGLDYGIVVGVSEKVQGKRKDDNNNEVVVDMTPRKLTGINATSNRFTCATTFAAGAQIALIFDINGGDVTGITPRKRYYVVNPTATDFQISETAGGQPVDFSLPDTNPRDIYVIPAGSHSIEYACDEWAAEHLIIAETKRVAFSVPNLAQSVFNTFGCQSDRVSVRVLGYASATRYEPRSVEFSELYTEGPFDTAYMIGKEFARIEGTQVRVANGPKCQYGETVVGNYITINSNYSDFGMMEVDDGNKIIVTGDGNTIRASVQGKENFIDDRGVNNNILFIKSYNGVDAAKEISFLSRYSINKPFGGFWPDHVIKGGPDVPYQSENVMFHLATDQLFYNNPAITYEIDNTLDVRGYVSVNTPAQLSIRNPLGTISNTFVIDRFFPRSRWMLYAKVRSHTALQRVTLAFQRIDGSGYGSSKGFDVDTTWKTIRIEVDHTAVTENIITGQIYVQPTTQGLDLAYFVVVPFIEENFSLRNNYGGGVVDLAGPGDPITKNVKAALGSTYRRTDSAAGPRFFIKQTQAATATEPDSTGWVAVTTA